eukprot:IDg7601t1
MNKGKESPHSFLKERQNPVIDSEGSTPDYSSSIPDGDDSGGEGELTVDQDSDMVSATYDVEGKLSAVSDKDGQLRLLRSNSAHYFVPAVHDDNGSRIFHAPDRVEHLK